MPRRLFVVPVILAIAGVVLSNAADEPKPPQRKPWTTSKVVGSPEPPPAFKAVRVFPNVKLPACENTLWSNQEFRRASFEPVFLAAVPLLPVCSGVPCWKSRYRWPASRRGYRRAGKRRTCRSY